MQAFLTDDQVEEVALRERKAAAELVANQRGGLALFLAVGKARGLTPSRALAPVPQEVARHVRLVPLCRVVAQLVGPEKLTQAGKVFSGKTLRPWRVR